MKEEEGTISQMLAKDWATKVNECIKPITIEISAETGVLRFARALAMEGLCMKYVDGKIRIVNRSRYRDGGNVRHGWVPDFLRHKTGE